MIPLELKLGMAFQFYHRPTEETLYGLGHNPRSGLICCGGWPPTIVHASDCEQFIQKDPLNSAEVVYRRRTFGEDWQ